MKRTKIYILLTIIMFLMVQCKNSDTVQPLPTDLFNYTKILKETMKDLSEKSSLLNLSNEQVLVEALGFTVTNKYAIPFLYFQLMNIQIPLEQMQKQDLEEMLISNAMDRALNHALFLEASKKYPEISDEEINDQIETMANGDIEQFRADIEEKTPFTWQFIQQEAHHLIIIEKYKQDIIKDHAEISESQIKTYYNDNPDIHTKPARATVRHILIGTNGLSEPQKVEARIKLEAIRQRIIDGEDFAALAVQYSEDPGSSASGGLVGEYIEKGQTMDEFDAIAFSQPIGKVSTLFETAYGYHLLLVDARSSVGSYTFEELHDRIKAVLASEQQNSTIDKEVERIKKAYSIISAVESGA